MKSMCKMAACLIFVSTAPTFAAEPNNFYQGKQVQFLIRAEPGGSYDLYMRTLAKYMVKYIPGSPTIIPVNMPGGGGLKSLNYLDAVAPHDGTAVAMITQTAPLEQALGSNPNLKTDLNALNWIGNMSEENTFLVVRASSETKSLKDAETRVTPLAASCASGSDYLLANILNTIYQTKFKSVLGYQSSPQMDMAIQRGEADGRFTASLAGLFSTSKEGAKGFRILVQIGSNPDAGFPDAPFLKRIPSDQPEAVNIISAVMSLGRPVATNSGVPADRVAILRTAFDETMKDTDFLRDAEKQQLDISPWSGAETQKVVDEIIHAKDSTKEFLNTAITSDKND